MFRHSGFSLVELMTVIAVASTIMTIGLPSFESTIVKNQSVSARDDLLSDLSLARTTAAKMGVPVTVCKTISYEGCNRNGNWGNGWLVFVDTNGDRLIGSDPILRVRNLSTSQLTVDTDVRAVTFSSSGFLYNGDGVEFSFCSKRDAQSQSNVSQLIVSNIGYLSVGSEGECRG